MFARIAVTTVPPRGPVYTFERTFIVRINLVVKSFVELPNDRPCNISLLQTQHFIVRADSTFS